MIRIFRVALVDDGSRQSMQSIRELECYWDAEEIKRGKWINDTLTGFKVVCSECGSRNFGADRNYCPNCGSYNAEIKEEADDDAFSD